MEGMSPSDIAALSRGNDDFGNGAWWLVVIILFAMMNGGWGGIGAGNAAAALGYENLATSNEVQRGFDNQNSMANQREILAAVNAGTAQSVATSNQVFHDMLGVFSDKYSELQRDIAGVTLGVTQLGANQNECCCAIQRAIDGVNYNLATQAGETQKTVAEWGQKILDAGTANRMADMQNQINQLQLSQAMQGVVRYPEGFMYNAGNNPFCGCGNGGCCNI